MEKTAKTVRKQKEDTHNLNALSRRLSESMEIVTLLLLATFSVCTEQCEWLVLWNCSNGVRAFHSS